MRSSGAAKADHAIKRATSSGLLVGAVCSRRATRSRFRRVSKARQYIRLTQHKALRASPYNEESEEGG